MNYTSLLVVFCVLLTTVNIFAENKAKEFDTRVSSDVGYGIDTELKDTNRTERDLLICEPGSSAPIVKVEIDSESSDYPRLCDYSRTISQFRISINITVKGVKRDDTNRVLTVLNVANYNEQRFNGSVKARGLGSVVSGVKSLVNTSFIVVYDIPNLNPAACYTIEGLTRQTGAGQLIFARIDSRRIDNLLSKYDTDQLVSTFRKYSVADCMGTSLISYTPGLLNERMLDELYPISTVEKRDTTQTIEQTLDECEPLSVNIVHIEEESKYITSDSCDAIDLFDRYENDLSEFSVYYDANGSPNVTQVRILYSNGFRNKGNFYGIAIGIVIKGPTALLGTAYLEILDIPNFNPYGCQSEPGIGKLVGSTEKIIASLDVQNLLSVMDLDSILTKIRSNRIVDCMGYITVNYSPGLVFSDVLLNEHKNIKKEVEVVEAKPKLRNPFKFNRNNKIFLPKMG